MYMKPRLLLVVVDLFLVKVELCLGTRASQKHQFPYGRVPGCRLQPGLRCGTPEVGHPGVSGICGPSLGGTGAILVAGPPSTLGISS